MNITTDWTLIRSFIERPDCIEGFHNKIWTDEELMDVNKVYFYEPGVGLFPSTVIARNIVMHAAIPKVSRGIKAIRAARELAEYLISNGYRVLTRNEDKPHLKAFVRLIGFTFLRKDNDMNIWEYRGKHNG